MEGIENENPTTEIFVDVDADDFDTDADEKRNTQYR